MHPRAWKWWPNLLITHPPNPPLRRQILRATRVSTTVSPFGTINLLHKVSTLSRARSQLNCKTKPQKLNTDSPPSAIITHRSKIYIFRWNLVFLSQQSSSPFQCFKHASSQSCSSLRVTCGFDPNHLKLHTLRYHPHNQLTCEVVNSPPPEACNRERESGITLHSLRRMYVATVTVLVREENPATRAALEFASCGDLLSLLRKIP